MAATSGRKSGGRSIKRKYVALQDGSGGTASPMTSNVAPSGGLEVSKVTQQVGVGDVDAPGTQLSLLGSEVVFQRWVWGGQDGIEG